MSGKDLLAIMADVRQDFSLEGVTSVSSSSYSAVFQTGSKGLWRQANRKSMLKNVVRRQRSLEDLMSFGIVMPVLPGTRLDPDAVPDLVGANAPVLSGLTDRLKGRVQFQVTIHWPSQDAPARFGWPDQAAIHRGSSDLATRIMIGLDKVAEESVELPREADMLLNAAVIVPRHEEARLDAVLEDVDAIWPEGFRIRQVGPAPAVSFASLGLRQIRPPAVRAARAALGVSAEDGAAVRLAARKNALMQAPPEMRASLMEAASLLDASSRIGSDRFPLLYTWREGRSAIEDDRRKVA